MDFRHVHLYIFSKNYLICGSLFWDKRRRPAQMAVLIILMMVSPNNITQSGCPPWITFLIISPKCRGNLSKKRGLKELGCWHFYDSVVFM